MRKWVLTAIWVFMASLVGAALPTPEMVLVKAGFFNMGYSSPAYIVYLTYDYSIGTYEVTFDEYDAFCEATGRTKPDDRSWGRERRPAIHVSWWDAIAYCNWLSIQEGVSPAYGTDGSLLDRDGKITSDVKQVEGYRLPSEAEWEYAARGGHVDFIDGKESKDFRYAGSHSLEDVAWHARNAERKTQPVGLLEPNELGLYDMSGNVSEWCHDWHEEYPVTSVFHPSTLTRPYGHFENVPTERTDPFGPASGMFRVRRGGSWINYPDRCRLSARANSSPSYESSFLGFRVVRTQVSSEKEEP